MSVISAPWGWHVGRMSLWLGAGGEREGCGEVGSRVYCVGVKLREKGMTESLGMNFYVTYMIQV